MITPLIYVVPVVLGLLAAKPHTTIAPAVPPCATLLPQEWKEGVPGADLPDGTVGGWEKFADAQTGRLDQANERTKAAIGIVERCEARDAAAVKKASRGFLGRLIHGG